MHERAAVALFLAAFGESPIEREDVVLVALVGVDEAGRLAANDQRTVFDSEDLVGVGPFVFVVEMNLQAGQILAIEDSVVSNSIYSQSIGLP